MARTLLVTNDYPPRPGGIQSYLHNLVRRLPADEIYVYAPPWRDLTPAFDEGEPYPIARHRGGLMLPEPRVAKRAADIIRAHDISTVWFGAAAPLALLGPALRRAGAARIVASTHGHEVGWSMLPVARQSLRVIGETADAVTFVSRYTRGRFASAFGRNAALEYLPPGVDVTEFAPNPTARAELRQRYGLGDAPTIVCLSRLVPRKGQDKLITALPLIADDIPDVRLVIVGGGPDRDRLVALAAEFEVDDRVVFTGAVPSAELAAHHAIADVFAMPARTRGKGLDVEGLGIVYLEASATGVPVVAGDSGGASETVKPGETGLVVDGRDIAQIAEAITTILADPDLAARMGAAGRAWIEEWWRWETRAERLRQLL